jgi:hypothetical protein
VFKGSIVRISIIGLSAWCALSTTRAIALDVADREIADGLAAYRHASATVLQLRYFGGFLRWTPRYVPLAPSDVIVTRAGLAFLTLDRYLGHPVFQRVLDAVDQSATPLTRDQFFECVERTSGRDLEWFWPIAFENGPSIDYAVDTVTATPASDCGFAACFLVTVTVRRNGDPFPGARRSPIGPYESGRAIVVVTTFADGTARRETWDGRSKTKTYMYVSRSPAARVEVDPDRSIALDAKPTNNSWSASPRAATAAVRWSARWLIWFQDLVLGYAFFV